MQATIRALAVVTTLVCASDAFAHGGGYQAPPLRGPRGPRGPRTPGTPPPTIPGAVTPSGGDVLPADPDDWTRWWFANRRLLLGDVSRGLSAGSGVTSADGAWRDGARRALRDALTHEDRDISSAAAVALGKMRDRDSTAALIELLRDAERHQSVREAAALALGLLAADAAGEGAATEALLDLVDDRRSHARLRAMGTYALALRGGPGAEDGLRRAASVKAKNDPEADVQSAALSGLGVGGFAAARGELEKRLAGRGAAKRGDRVYAAHGLARLGGGGSLAPLRTTAGSKDANTRRAAALALGVLGRGDEPSGVVLAAMLRDDPDPSCRGAAAIGLGRTAPAGAKAALAAVVASGDGTVAPFAALGLALLAVGDDDADALRPLVTQLRDSKDSSLRGALACALGIGRVQEAAPLLLEIVQERGDPRLRAHAAFALGRLEVGVEARQALRELLVEREHPWMPREAALALGSLRDAASARMLRRLVVSDPSLHVQAAAALAMGSIGGDPAGAGLTELLADGTKKPIARAMAAVALGRMLDRGGEERLASIGVDLDWQLFTPAVEELLTIL